MADRLVTWGGNPTARKLVSSVGLSLPPSLKRETGPWSERALEGREIAVLQAPGAACAAALARTLAVAGVSAAVLGGIDPFEAAGEAWARTPIALSDDVGEKERWNGIVVDATGIEDTQDLRAVYLILHARIRRLASSGRVVVLARPPESAASVTQSAVRRALDGFTRSLARELGRKGSTANLLVVPAGAEDRVDAPLRFLLSARSAYVSGQPWVVSPSVSAPAALPWRRPLDGKVALVTGGAQGIGAATCRALAREGAHVVVLDRPDADTKVARVAAEIGGTPLLADLSESDTPAKVAAALRSAHGGVDIIVQNAGVTRDKTLGGMKEDRWDLVLGVNLDGVIALHEALEPLLRVGGRVVCLSSIAGLAGNPGQTNYAASKAGVAGLVAALGPRLADRGIAVNAVAPGFIETRMTAAIPLATRQVARRLCNLSQGGLPEDVAEVITFLSSPGASALCGQTLRVCGGNLLGA